ncbi:hypothetical protein [Paucisalibacillus globulus]|uniref:hypothetical protein n=1 Tax=Paucisalibacillus globulus TaxID=351095 RepID=UPI0020D044D7|nr:hypothetical protein [Paucisalibacillus globulus]
MAIASKLTIIGMIALSLAIGFLFFYLYSDLKKEQKKKHIEELTSQLINFIMFIWLGKIVLNLSTFLTDPLSVLAYPSDSKALYFAIVLIALLLLYKSRRKSVSLLPLMESFVHVFLISSFVYEFIQLIVEDNSYAFGYVILLAILIGIFFFLRERLNVIILLIILVTTWSLGMISIALIQPFVTVFGYMMAPWFVGVIFIASIGSLTYILRKRDA